MSLTLIIFVVGSILSGWSILRCMGNERQRQMDELASRLQAEIAAPAEPSPSVPATTAGPRRA